MRVEIKKSEAWCDWIARPVDVWDADLSASVSERNFTMQTLDDALNVRAILFETLTNIQTAELRAFRSAPQGEPELILIGSAFRDDRRPAPDVSLAMQAKLLGFHFTVADNALIHLATERHVPA
ncbi:MAG TPA: hypothetical protein VG714_05705 [Acidobacteriaceae bacterium]|nr:hypothetical protein [Acidobacteriaceae bacterium]